MKGLEKSDQMNGLQLARGRASEAAVNSALQIKATFLLKQMQIWIKFPKHLPNKWSWEVKYLNTTGEMIHLIVLLSQYSFEWLEKGRIVWYCLSGQIFNLPVPGPVSNLQDPFQFHQKAKLQEQPQLLNLFWCKELHRIKWLERLLKCFPAPNDPRYWQSSQRPR